MHINKQYVVGGVGGFVGGGGSGGRGCRSAAAAVAFMCIKWIGAKGGGRERATSESMVEQ